MKVAFRDFLSCDVVYSPADVSLVLAQVRPCFEFAYTNTQLKYFDVPCSFDIETSSFFRSTGKNEREKVAIMYEWTLGIYGLVIVGRTWEEFLNVLSYLSAELRLNECKRLIIYVHNLGYEFQFMRLWLDWQKVFSIETRKPIYALTTNGIEFRCSYLLSGVSLDRLGEELRTYKVRKLVGALDYEKLRHSETALTSQEIAYCVNDVKVVMAYVAERIEQDGSISRIPLTKTGYVRAFCRNACFYGLSSKRDDFKRSHYAEIMRGLCLSVDEYKQLKRAFQGGFTHANPFFSGKVVLNVGSFDFTSSYPAVMVAEQFPMSSSERVTIKSKEEFNRCLNLYCCLFDVEFINLQSQLFFENYISLSRCWNVEKAVVNNGRVVSAEHLCTTLTEQDFLIIQKFYTWKKIKIGTFRRYKKDYLPHDFVSAILKLYSYKTTLKGVEGKEVDYLRSKEMLNSTYGMVVTNVVRDEILYLDDNWQESRTTDFEKAIRDYNNNQGRFLFYPWGVWVTAYARRNLFSGVLELKNDYIYSDTDSIKGRNIEKHQAYVDAYNALIKKQLCAAMDYHGLPHQAIEPMTIDGKKKCLGAWDFDGHYSRFKTLGAKRYLVEYSQDERNKKSDRGTLKLTVAGLNKQTCVPWLASHGSDEAFSRFSDDLHVPAEYTGKMTHTYIDDPRKGVLTDYNGVSCEYFEKSAIHLENADYSLSISQEYAEYLAGIQTDEY